jgi:hypothetical protein
MLIVKINRYFNNFNKFSTNFNNKKFRLVGMVMIWIDHENFVTFGLVMVKFGLSILTMAPQFDQIIKKSGSLNPQLEFNSCISFEGDMWLEKKNSEKLVLLNFR